MNGRVRRWAGTSAIAAVVLFSVANALWAFEQPSPEALGPELLDFYDDLSGRIVAGALLSLGSIALFTVFAGAFRSLLSAAEGDDLLANLVFGGLLLGLAAGLGAESINMAAALRAADDALTEPLALALFDVSYVLGSYAAATGFGVATLGIGWAALRTRELLPRWIAIAAIAFGAAQVMQLATALLGEYVVGPSMVMLLVLGVRLRRPAP